MSAAASSESQEGRGVRERILDAAIEVLSESGVQRLKQTAVSERAGVRQSHLTYYFPTRNDLLEAVTAYGVDLLASGIRETVDHEGPGGEGALLERLTESVGEPGHMRMFLGMIVEADADPAIREKMVAATIRMETTLSEGFEGTAASERARVALACAWGLGLYRFLVRPAAGSDPTRAYLTWAAELAPGQEEVNDG